MFHIVCHFLAFVFFIHSFVDHVSGVCYLPFEHHGAYAVQGADKQYSQVVIEVNRILPYGTCHAKTENNLILRDEKSGCLRCFHMLVRSPNVLQLYSRRPAEECHSYRANITRSLCPSAQEIDSPQHLADGRVHELIMYKVMHDRSVGQTFCPISGQYSFLYRRPSQPSGGHQCSGDTSHMPNCPSGLVLHLHSRRCFDNSNLVMNLRCLGGWTDSRGNKVMALLDLDAKQNQLRYRCAMYSVDERTGRVQMALSSDSSCHRHLTNASHGFELIELQPTLRSSWPTTVSTSSCQLPSWARGEWGSTRVTAKSIFYQDDFHFRKYTAKCVAAQGEKFLVFSRSNCGAESYRCIWLKRQGVNLLQYQISKSYSSVFCSALCDDKEFGPDRWITESRSDVVEPVPCPVFGQYNGVIPETGSLLCARLYSACDKPGIMFFTVASCNNFSEIYEEREYQCLGTWRRGTVMYTYTQRRDVLTFECFAGLTLNDGRYYIAEAGIDRSCQHSVQPNVSGMLIHKIASCYQRSDQDNTVTRSSPAANNRSRGYTLNSRSRPTAVLPAVGSVGRQVVQEDRQLRDWTSNPFSTATPPWRPITTRPRPQSSSGSLAISNLLLLATLICLSY